MRSRRAGGGRAEGRKGGTATTVQGRTDAVFLVDPAEVVDLVEEGIIERVDRALIDRLDHADGNHNVGMRQWSVWPSLLINTCRSSPPHPPQLELHRRSQSQFCTNVDVWTTTKLQGVVESSVGVCGGAARKGPATPASRC